MRDFDGDTSTWRRFPGVLGILKVAIASGQCEFMGSPYREALH